MMGKNEVNVCNLGRLIIQQELRKDKYGIIKEKQ